MKCKQLLIIAGLIVAMLAGGCKDEASDAKSEGASSPLIGAWKATIQFNTGAFAPVKDLEFMYTFHADGTMMESSNYDAAPPVPPAYGIWKKVDAHKYLAHYEFFMTAAPDSAAKASGVDGWVPAGTGILTEEITLSADGNTFTSELKFEARDRSGKVTDMGGEAKGNGIRISL